MTPLSLASYTEAALFNLHLYEKAASVPDYHRINFLWRLFFIKVSNSYTVKREKLHPSLRWALSEANGLGVGVEDCLKKLPRASQTTLYVIFQDEHEIEMLPNLFPAALYSFVLKGDFFFP